MNINWYPGHMVKAKKSIKESLKLVDVVIEIVDARIPASSRNPDVDELIEGKPRVLGLNKSDLSTRSGNEEWVKYYSSIGVAAVPIDSSTGNGVKNLIDKVYDAAKDKLERQYAKGRIGRPVRAAVLGIPNSGKSSFINRVAGRSAAQVANRPGVTRIKQWVKAGNGVELLDTPGVLWPKLGNEMVGLHLAFTGAIKDQLIDTIETVMMLIDELKKDYSAGIISRYKITGLNTMSAQEALNAIAQRRGCILPGGKIDIVKASLVVLEDFRTGKLGQITLEYPQLLSP